MKAFEQGIVQVMGNLKKFEALLADGRKEILRYAARPLISTIQSATPVGTVTHRRYVPKEKGEKRSAKGRGKVLATYSPGNLRASIEELTNLRRTDSVWVGPRGRRIKRGGPRKGDGYYAVLVDQGTRNRPATPFFYRSVAVAAGEVKKRLEFGFQIATNKFKPL